MFLRFKCIKNYFPFLVLFFTLTFWKITNFLVIFYVTLIVLLKFKHADGFLVYLEEFGIGKTA